MIPFVQDWVLAGIMLLAAGTDCYQRKIHNWLTYPALIAGMGLQAGLYGWPGAWSSLAGALIAALLFFPAFYWGGMGAGDIKLMAVVGAWKGILFGFNTAILAALAGGLMAVAVLLWQGQLGPVMRRLGGKVVWRLGWAANPPEPSGAPHTLPYGVAIAAGAFLAYFLPII